MASASEWETMVFWVGASMIQWAMIRVSWGEGAGI